MPLVHRRWPHSKPLRRNFGPVLADAALVGAADGNDSQFCFMCFAKTHALSPDGHSKSFDAAANGIGLGEGVGAIVLKRLRDAERNSDQTNLRGH